MKQEKIQKQAEKKYKEIKLNESEKERQSN